MRNRLFGFGYYEGHRNTSGVTQNFVVLSDAQRTGSFGSTTINDPVTGQPFPGNQIPQDRIDPAAAQLISEFVPRANTGANRYVISPDVVDDRDQLGMRSVAMLPDHRDRVAVLEPGVEDDPLAHVQALDALAERLDGPRAVGTEDPRLRHRGEPFAHPDVEVVEGRRLEADEHLACAGHRIGHLLDPDHLRAAILVDARGKHGTILA